MYIPFWNPGFVLRLEPSITSCFISHILSTSYCQQPMCGMKVWFWLGLISLTPVEISFIPLRNLRHRHPGSNFSLQSFGLGEWVWCLVFEFLWIALRIGCFLLIFDNFCHWGFAVCTLNPKRWLDTSQNFWVQISWFPVQKLSKCAVACPYHTAAEPSGPDWLVRWCLWIHFLLCFTDAI